jgi:hypothetical protein
MEALYIKYDDKGNGPLGYRKIEPNDIAYGTVVYLKLAYNRLRKAKIVRITAKNIQCGTDWYRLDGRDKKTSGYSVYIKVDDQSAQEDRI